MKRSSIPAEALVKLRQRLELLPPRARERRLLMEETAELYGVSVHTLYRALRERSRPKGVHRSDRGQPRKVSEAEMERYCEIIAAMKLRSRNRKGRHLSTARALELLYEHGIETPSGLLQPPKGLLTTSTVNHYLKQWGYGQANLRRQPPAVRFQAEQSNECWQFDLSPSDKQVKIPSSGEKRERELRELFRKGKKPVALFVDEAHDLHSSTLTGLKRLLEVVEDGGGTLSIVLGGHPKLKNDLRRPTMEEIGYRTAVFSLDSIGGCQGEYIQWLLGECVAEGIEISELVVPEAIDLLSQRLRTPLQIEQHLSLAFEEAHRMGEKPVSLAVVESILSKQIDDLEPTLTRHGYNVKSLSEQFNAKPAEIRSLFRGQLDPMRARELQEQMLAAGLPL